MTETLQIMLDHPDARIPTYAHEDDAGADLYAVMPEGESSLVVGSGEHLLIPTGLRISIPAGYEVQVRPRSGMALKHGITVLNSPGTIDCSYRGPVGVILHNTSEIDFTVRTGDRIAQMVVAKLPKVTLNQVDSLDETVRGSGGFGSTGA